LVELERRLKAAEETAQKEKVARQAAEAAQQAAEAAQQAAEAKAQKEQAHVAIATHVTNFSSFVKQIEAQVPMARSRSYTTTPSSASSASNIDGGVAGRGALLPDSDPTIAASDKNQIVRTHSIECRTDDNTAHDDESTNVDVTVSIPDDQLKPLALRLQNLFKQRRTHRTTRQKKRPRYSETKHVHPVAFDMLRLVPLPASDGPRIRLYTENDARGANAPEAIRKSQRTTQPNAVVVNYNDDDNDATTPDESDGGAADASTAFSVPSSATSATKHSDVERYPDALFHKHGSSSTDTKLTRCAARNAVLPVELKRNLDAQQDEALAGALRDYARFIGHRLPFHSHTLPVLIGDGIDYELWLFHAVFDKNSGQFKVQRVRQHRIELVTAENQSDVAKICDNVRQLLQTCHSWLSKSDERAGGLDWPDELEDENYVAVLGVTSRVVVLRRRDSGNQYTAVKLPVKDLSKRRDVETEHVQKLRRLLSKEACEQLHLPCVVDGLLETREPADAKFDCLDMHCLCDSATRLKAAQTIVDAIVPLLELLHDQRHAFVDVHPGNIVMSADASVAYLVDFESVTEFDKAYDVLPVRPGFRVVGHKTVDASVDFKSLLLVLHWLLDTGGFRRVPREHREERCKQLLNSVGAMSDAQSARLVYKALLADFE